VEQQRIVKSSTIQTTDFDLSSSCSNGVFVSEPHPEARLFCFMQWVFAVGFGGSILAGEQTPCAEVQPAVTIEPRTLANRCCDIAARLPAPLGPLVLAIPGNRVQHTAITSHGRAWR
jgi:hypothetical protein